MFARKEPYRSLGWALFWVRWATVAVLLSLSLAQPATGRLGMPLWGMILMFAANNLLVDLLGLRWSWPRSFARRAVLDLPVVGVIYLLGAEHGGVTFALLFLAVVCAAASMSLRAGFLYLAAVSAVVLAVHPTFDGWSLDEGGLRELGSDLTVLFLTGAGTAALTRRLLAEQETSRSALGEAERLAERDRLRADFVSAASHDLRTPLTAARAGLGMLEGSAAERLRPDERELLRNARRNTEMLGMLVDDLLAFNQLEAGVMRLDHEPLDLRAVVREAAAAALPLIQNKGQILELNLPEALPSEGDPRRLRQVVVNLLSNAHLHTPAGTRIEVYGRAFDTEVRLSVSDEGAGIPEGELEAVFRRFHRLSSTGDGSGIGLAVVRSIVELHGGRAWAESEPGRGAVFHVSLPRHGEGGGT